jgi:glycosyltransferase involved in cell wall biosynthesis
LDERFVIINVNRNQTRKDYMRTFQVVKALKTKYPEIKPLLLAVASVQDQGGDLIKLAAQCGLEYGKDFTTPKNYNPGKGYDVEAVNMWYNCADVVFSSTLGEGFGLSSIEGMACGIPVVFPNNTSLREILADGLRGTLVPCGKVPEDFITMGQFDSSIIRPRMSIDDAVESLYIIYSADKFTGPIAKIKKDAHDWARTMDWRNVNKFWIELFAKASADKAE